MFVLLSKDFLFPLSLSHFLRNIFFNQTPTLHHTENDQKRKKKETRKEKKRIKQPKRPPSLDILLAGGDLLDFRLALFQKGGIIVVFLRANHDAAGGALGGSRRAEVFLGGDVNVGDLLLFTKNWHVGYHVNGGDISGDEHNTEIALKEEEGEEGERRRRRREGRSEGNIIGWGN